MILNGQNLKIRHLIDDIVINIWFYKNYASIKNIKKKYIIE